MNLDNEPARTDMTLDQMIWHLSETLVIEVHEPKLNLSQGSWLRARRENASATINTLLSAATGNVRLTVKDSMTAAEARRMALEVQRARNTR